MSTWSRASRSTRNHLGRHSYPKTTLTRRLQQPGKLADIRDSQGRRPPLSNVHRIRHTRPTSVINAGVPLHVVQRYLGHLSSEMTMRYAHTLRKTHEREFLRYKMITAAGSQLELDQRDLFALIELGKRTYRVLPNGLCMLPPRQTCDRGNACLTCDKFTTDVPEHEAQLRKLSELIAQRQDASPRRNRRGHDPQQRVAPSSAWPSSARWRRSSPCSKTCGSARTGQGVRGAGTSAAPPTSPPATPLPEMPRGNPDNLRAAAQRKREAATQRAETALNELIASRAPITFRGLGQDRRCVNRLPISLLAPCPGGAAPRRPTTHATLPAGARGGPAAVAEQRAARAHRAYR